MRIDGLSQLLDPISENVFFQQYWPYLPLFVPTQANKLKQIFELAQLQDLDSLVGSRILKVRACLPDFDDEYSSIHLEPKDAIKAYRNNMTLVFDSMQTQEPVIDLMLQKIRQDLGLVTGGGDNNLCHARALVYATPAGGGTRLHFDANANFIIQIHGSKRWMLAPNTSVVNPTERFTAGALEMPVALEKQCHDQLLNELPEDCQEVLMQPGCVLFVPRGYWHSTTTDEDSLSLNFTFSQPTWADVFSKSLQQVLLNSPEWRELADGLEGLDLARKARAIQRFEELLKQLALDLPLVSGRQFLIEGNFL